MPATLIIASNNPYKTAEMQHILSDFGLQSASYQKLINKVAFPKETTTSFRQNVNTKALFISQKLPQELIIADDSGIFLDACPGHLGVVTSRELAPYMPNYVDRMLEMVAGKSRHYKMRSYTTIAKGGGILSTGEGELTGDLAESPRVDVKDGFDSILIPEGLTKTLNQLSRADWLKYAHRSRAVKAVLTKAGLMH